jgi:glycosyltransferase involved in cell wall biosynthesis
MNLIKKKIFITSNKTKGGVQTYALGLKDALTHYGYCVEIVDEPKSILDKNFRNSIRQRDTVIISSLGLGYFNFFAANSIYVLHGFPRLDDRGFLVFIKIWLATLIFSKRANRVVAVSQFTRVINSSFLGIKSHFVIGNTYKNANKVEDIKKININKRFLYVGRLITVKNVLEALLGFKELCKKNSGVEFVIAGYGPEEERLRELTVGLPVKFLGYVENEMIPKLMLECDVFVSLSDGENFGITFLEALAAGMVIVCPTCGGHVDFLVDYTQVCYVSDVKSTQKIAESLEKALRKSEDKFQLLSETWNEKIGQKYSQIIETMNNGKK